jgi:hypothetical protein
LVEQAAGVDENRIRSSRGKRHERNQGGQNQQDFHRVVFHRQCVCGMQHHFFAAGKTTR